MAKLAAFYDTRCLYLESTGYTEPLSYEEWAAKPDNLKAAFLYLQFYNEIVLAWTKADCLEIGDDTEGVSTILQYLEKQVRQVQYFCKANPKKKASAEFRRTHPDEVIAVERRIIDENPQKFSPGYIYRTAYNCLYCICGHDRKCDKDRYENETSGIVIQDGKEVSIIDSVADKRGSASDTLDSINFQNEFWSVISELGAKAEKVMRYLLSHDEADLKKLNARSKLYEHDPLRDVEVSIEEAQEIIKKLRYRFMNMSKDSNCGQYLLKIM